MNKQEKDMHNYLCKMKEFLEIKNYRYKEFLKNKDNIFKEFDNEKEELGLEVKNLRDDLSDQKKIDSENSFDFVKKDENFDPLVKYLCYEATIEDTFPIIKRGFTKGAINFNDSIKEIRRLSRDLFKLKVFKDKIFNNIKQRKLNQKINK